MSGPDRETSSPLRALCQADVAQYQDSLARISSRLHKNSASQIWREPLQAPSLIRILSRWVEIDALEEQRALTEDQVIVLRAETLAAYAEAERDPKARDAAVAHLSFLSGACTAECRARGLRLAEALGAKLG